MIFFYDYVENMLTFSEKCALTIEAAIPKAIEKVLAALEAH